MLTTREGGDCKVIVVLGSPADDHGEIKVAGSEEVKLQLCNVGKW